MTDHVLNDDLAASLQQTLGKNYRVSRELGGGGMSRVFVARDLTLERDIVVKVLSGEATSGVSADRFRREITTAAGLQHPHIVPVLSAGETNGVPYFTMPFVDGNSLRARIAGRGAAMGIAESVKILREVAQALAFAHERGFVHRDIKPDNVLLADGVAVVTDFGVAKALSSATNAKNDGLTGVGLALGTPAYMAPEQVSADPDVDHRADIYAWACMAYELLVGATPFGHRTPAQLFAAHLTEKPKPIREIRPDVPAPLAALVERSLAKDPNNRPQSARELLAGLDGAIIPSSSSMSSAPATAARNRSFMMIAALLVVVVAASAWAFMLNRAPAASALDNSVVVLPFENAGGDSTQEFFSDGLTDELIGRLASTGLRVTGRNTAFSFKGQHPTPRAVGQVAGVATVLTGSVRRSGDELRITAELARTSNDSVLFSMTFPARRVADVFAVQRDIVDSIMTRFKTARTKNSQEMLTTTVAAHDLYLRALAEYNTLSLEGITKAIALYDSVIVLDPHYAPAYTDKVFAIISLADGYQSPRLVYPRALAALKQAHQVDSTSGAYLGRAAYISIAMAWDWITAQQQLDRAVKADSSNAFALFTNYVYQFHTGDIVRAKAVLAQARRADPLAPFAPLNQLFLFAVAGRGDSAMAVWNEVPPSMRAINYGDVPEGIALLAANRNEEAERVAHAAEPTLGHPSTARGVALARLGRKAEAQAQLQAIQRRWKQSYFPPELIATVPAALGDTATMYRWLETGFRERSAWAAYLGIWGGELGQHRNEPHFQDILRRVGAANPKGAW